MLWRDGVRDALQKAMFRISVEPCIAGAVFMGACADGVIMNLLSERVCEDILGLDEGNCSGNRLSPSAEAAVQPYTSALHLSRTLIETLLPAVLSFFIGPWTDSNGRKPFILAPLFGYLSMYLMWGVFSLVKVSPYVMLAASLPLPLCGGIMALVVSSTCYLTDVSPPQQRAYRFGVLEGSINLGMLLGFFCSPYISSLGGRHGYSVVFFSNSAIAIILLLYTYFGFEESIKDKKAERARVLDVSHMKDVWEVVWSKRPGRGRSLLLLAVAVSAIKTLAFEGEMFVRYLSVRRAFSWDLKQYTTFTVVNLLTTLVCSWMCTWLVSAVGLPEVVCATLSMSWYGVAAAGMALSTTPGVFYLATVLTLLRSVPGPLVTSTLLRIVPPSDIGKVVSFLHAVASLTPQPAALLYLGVYSPLEKAGRPLLIYFVTAALAALCVLILTAMQVIISTKKRVDGENNTVEVSGKAVNGDLVNT